MLAVSLVVVGQCTGCAPAKLSPASATCPAVTGASVVTLVRQLTEWQWAPLSQDFEESGFRTRWAPYCSAFAVRGPVLVTAAHCLAGAKVGDAIRYREPNGVGLGVAFLARFDEALDGAVLTVDSGSGLVPLPIAAAPLVGEPVLSVSSLYETTSRGRVAAQLSSGYVETTQTIVHGWSGAPVLNARGGAWGIVSRCGVAAGASECEPGRAVVAPLPAELAP
jgi:hypothetical protein